VFGVPDLPLLKIQHPLGGLNMDKVVERAAVALPQLLKVVSDKQQENSHEFACQHVENAGRDG
jgi:hypothetical protein